MAPKRGRGKPFEKQDDQQERLQQTQDQYPSAEPWTLPNMLRKARKSLLLSSPASSATTHHEEDKLVSPLPSQKRGLEVQEAPSSVKERLESAKLKMARLQEDSRNSLTGSSVLKKVLETVSAQGVQPYSLQTLQQANTARNRWLTFLAARKLDSNALPTDSIMRDFVESTLSTNVLSTNVLKRGDPLKATTVHNYLWQLRKIVFPKMYASAFSATMGWPKTERDAFFDRAEDHLVSFTTLGAITQAAVVAGKADAKSVSDSMHKFTEPKTKRDYATQHEMELFQQMLFGDPLQKALSLQVDVYIALAEQISLRTSSVVQAEMHRLDASSLYHDRAPITLGMVKFSRKALGKNSNGRELDSGIVSKLTCTVKQDANKGNMAGKWNFEHTVSPNHQNLIRSGPHRVLRGCANRGVFAASHVHNKENTMKMILDGETFEGLTLKDHGYASEEAHLQAIWESDFQLADIEGILDRPLVCEVTANGIVKSKTSMKCTDLGTYTSEGFHDLGCAPHAGGLWSWRKAALHRQLREKHAKEAQMMAGHKEKLLKPYEGDNADYDAGAAALGEAPLPVKHVKSMAFFRVPDSQQKIIWMCPRAAMRGTRFLKRTSAEFVLRT